MGPMPVVVVNPVIERFHSLRGVVIDEAVGPLAQSGLNDALGLAVVAAVRSSKAMLDMQQAADGGKVARAKGRAVVAQQAPGVATYVALDCVIHARS